MLWILTQNKQDLMNVKSVAAKGKHVEGFVENSLLDQWNKVMGKYESNDRALEVLTEIFAKIDQSDGAAVTSTMPEQ